MQRQPAYITIEGQPLCQREGGGCGLMSTLRVDCGHRSIVDATRAKREIQKHRKNVKGVHGECPSLA